MKRVKTKLDEILTSNHGLTLKISNKFKISEMTIRKARRGGKVSWTTKNKIFNGLLEFGAIKTGEINAIELCKPIQTK